MSETSEVIDWPQLAWDALGILGFDLDGDPTPTAVVDFPAHFLRCIREVRADYDEACGAVSDAYDAGREAGHAEAMIVVEQRLREHEAGCK